MGRRRIHDGNDRQFDDISGNTWIYISQRLAFHAGTLTLYVHRARLAFTSHGKIRGS